jgi:hypothetical protein
VLQLLRVVRDLHRPPARLLHTNLVRDGFDVGMFEIHLARAGALDGDDRVRAALAASLAAGEDLARRAKTRAPA